MAIRSNKRSANKSEKRTEQHYARKSNYMPEEKGLKRELRILAVLLLLFLLPLISGYLKPEFTLYKTGLIIGTVINLYYVLNYIIKVKAGVHNRYFKFVRLLLNLIVLLIPALTGGINTTTDLISYLGGLLTGNLAVLLLLYTGGRIYTSRKGAI